MNRKLRLLSWVLLLSVILAACASPATPTPLVVEKQVEKTVVVTQIVKETQPAQVVTATAAPTQPASKTDVMVIRAGTGDGGDGLTPHQQIIQNFEDKNPNIIVQLEPVSGRDYYARLLTQLAAKAAPDIMQVGDDAVPSFVAKNAFVPLDDLSEGQQL